MNFKDKLALGLVLYIPLSLCLFSSTIFAAEKMASNESPAIFSMSLEELLNVKVSIASRFQQSLIDTPSNVTIISQSELKRWNVSSLWHLIARVPGMTATLDRDQKIISSRGLVDGNTRGVLILVNGVPFYDSNTLASRGIESQPLNLDLVEQVEILRGPGGLSWTGNPLLAVINLKMKDASEQESEVHTFIGTENTYGGSFLAGIDKGGWQLNLNASYYKSDGKKIESLSSINPENDRIRLTSDFSNQNPPFGVSQFQLDGHKESYSLFGELSYGTFSAQGFYMDFLGNNRQQEVGMGRELLENLSRGMIDLSYDWIIDPNTIVNASFTGAKHDMIWSKGKQSETTIGLVRKSKNYTYSLALKKSWLKGELNVSLDYLTRGQSTSENTNELITPPSFSARPSISLDQFNFVTQYDYPLLENFDFKVGGKWVDSKQGGIHFSSFNPQLATIWKRNKKQVFKLAYNTGTLRPDADQIQQGLNETTEQQTMTSLDLIWYQQLPLDWRSTFTLYRQDLDDRIIQRVVNGVKSYGTIGDTRSRGFSLELTGNIQEQAAWANVSYTDAYYAGNAPDALEPDSLRFDESGQALAYPEWTANLGLSYDLDNIIVSPALRYLSPTTNRIVSSVDSVTGLAQYQDMPSSFQIDLNVEYAFSEKIDISLSISNLFDEDDIISTSIFNGYTEQYGRFTKLKWSQTF